MSPNHVLATTYGDLFFLLVDPSRLAKTAKKEREGKGKGGDAAGKGGAGAKSKKGPKPKMTKEERRAKYTQK